MAARGGAGAPHLNGADGDDDNSSVCSAWSAASWGNVSRAPATSAGGSPAAPLPGTSDMAGEDKDCKQELVGLRLVLVRHMATRPRKASKSATGWTAREPAAEVTRAGRVHAAQLAKHLFLAAKVPSKAQASMGCKTGMTQWAVAVDNYTNTTAAWQAICDAGLDISDAVSLDTVIPGTAAKPASALRSAHLLKRLAGAWAKSQAGATTPQHLGLVYMTTAQGIAEVLNSLGMSTTNLQLAPPLGGTLVLTVLSTGPATLHLGDTGPLLASEESAARAAACWDGTA